MNSKLSKNVIIIVVAQDVGGVEKRFYNIFLQLIQNKNTDNFKFTFVFSNQFLLNIKHENKLLNPNIKLLKYGIKNQKYLPHRIINLINYIFLLKVLLIERLFSKIDIVHLVTTSSLKYRKLFVSKKIIHSFYNGGSTNKAIYKKVHKRIFSENIILDCLSSNIANILINEAGVSPSKVFTSPCSFIDYSECGVFRNEKEKMICFAGRLNEQKGLNLLTPIISEIVNKIPDIQIVILGKGPLNSKIQSVINEKKLNKNVTLTYDSNPKKYLRKSMVFLSLQQNENYPSQSLLEAMACGNAIIATNVGLTNLLVSNNNGILIKENSTELLNAIINLFNSPEKTLKMGEFSYNKVIQEHTFKRFFSYLTGLYENI